MRRWRSWPSLPTLVDVYALPHRADFEGLSKPWVPRSISSSVKGGATGEESVEGFDKAGDVRPTFNHDSALSFSSSFPQRGLTASWYTRASHATLRRGRTVISKS